MASEGLERHLHETDRRVAVGEEQILGQRAIIVDLEPRGDDANLAKEQLQTLEERQALRVADRERVSKVLGSKPIRSCAAASASGPIPDIGDVDRFVRDGPITEVAACSR
jgi:hypothetical protein